MSYADIDGLSLYYEEHGSGGTPLVLLHGGMAGGEIFAGLLPALSAGRRVIVPDLQSHGRTADIDRPLRAGHLADDIVALYALLGGGLRDAGWDGSGRPRARLAILPGATHYDVFASPLLAPAIV